MNGENNTLIMKNLKVRKESPPVGVAGFCEQVGFCGQVFERPGKMIKRFDSLNHG